jgi:hypothetical protein
MIWLRKYFGYRPRPVADVSLLLQANCSINPNEIQHKTPSAVDVNPFPAGASRFLPAAYRRVVLQTKRAKGLIIGANHSTT